MTREELKEHCKRQVQQFERVEKIMPVTPNYCKRYEEHKLILELLEQKPRWIPVSERLPEESKAVLIWCPERKNIYCAYLEEEQWRIFGAYWEEVTEKIVAWMPLPKPYKAESENP